MSIQDHDTRPAPKNLNHHLSRNTLRRQPSSMKQFYKYFAIPGIGQLAGGLPNNYYFPFDALQAKVAQPERWQPTPNDPVDPPATSRGKNPPSEAIRVPHMSDETDPFKRIDVSSALQYGTALGYPPLFRFVREFTQNALHPNCPYRGGPEVLLTCGNTDGFNKCLMALTNEWGESTPIRKREGLLCEEFTYMNAIQTARPRGLNLAPVAMDQQGMKAYGPGGLEEVLRNWDPRTGIRPHVMYTVTMGQNPTSGVLSLQRRREIYALCCEYDIVIIEDDPYWYLQYPTTKQLEQNMLLNGEVKPKSWKKSGFPFLDALVPSYISIDIDGRVIRLDSFSKTVAPGCRLGWISAQPALIERLTRITETTTQQPSGFVQSIIAELLVGPTAAKDEETPWKPDGFVRWLEGLRGNYERRMHAMTAILDEGKSLPTVAPATQSPPRKSYDNISDWDLVSQKDIYTFTHPLGGMFIWLKVLFETHPLFAHYKQKNRLQQFAHALWIYWTRKPFRVLVSPGNTFAVTTTLEEREGWRCFRVCFAAIDESDLKDATRRLVDGVHRFWGIRDVKIIEELLESDETLEVGECLPLGTYIC
ncbi:PLP-dependent transferase [Piedraia hortae CBS 480.64]|uniref:PLP-dependent transferase n=1 Tax=Piedraia hortae CBS 480.64 TaxID=1314780 RepID=A0A6A7BWZ4_9PEZI|nr:PLP-dependent transferase [Piedraia hortae CBS 480.64]